MRDGNCDGDATTRLTVSRVAGIHPRWLAVWTDDLIARVGNSSPFGWSSVR